MASGVNTNQLADIGFGFNNPTANLFLNAQLAPGIRVAMTSYLSARHHNETWVKDGYLQIDESPIDFAPLNSLMKVVTVRVGDMEINYGDAHFRRSDNGQAIYNPFIGNYIMDGFTTQIGGEAYLKMKGVIGMFAVTGGELRGTVLTPEQRGPTTMGKIGFDRLVKPRLARSTDRLDVSDRQGDERHALRRRSRRLALLLGARKHAGPAKRRRRSPAPSIPVSRTRSRRCK